MSLYVASPEALCFNPSLATATKMSAFLPMGYYYAENGDIIPAGIGGTVNAIHTLLQLCQMLTLIATLRNPSADKACGVRPARRWVNHYSWRRYMDPKSLQPRGYGRRQGNEGELAAVNA
ncbi:hypothetical protein EXIGLDRAFT_215940 [Exidia glandulosa HHB12029]|uniref:Uncharacterized protein n=1 Tax=Exidia glandulosa HHB12029 TaxID=1314781 RepID=A0A165EG35_EXIGL|nr:hypothetical protein EXIGLDRAFT_215940 [Exidia glandulosa HHB12029]